MTRKDRILIFLSIAAVLAVFAFITLSYLLRPKLEHSFLVGTYSARVDGKDSRHYLELKADGTYAHRFTGPDGQKVENSGTWELEIEEPFSRYPSEVVLKDFVKGVPELDAFSSGKGWRGVPIERPLLGPVRLVISYDYDYIFTKRKSAK